MNNNDTLFNVAVSHFVRCGTASTSLPFVNVGFAEPGFSDIKPESLDVGI